MPSLTNLKLIAQGNTAEIYDYAPDKILKLFRPSFPLEPILTEYKNAQFVSHELLNVPRVYDLIASGDRHGIIYEKVTGPSMISAILKSPHKLKHNSRQLARLHFALHSHKIAPPYPSNPFQKIETQHPPFYTIIVAHITKKVNNVYAY